MLDILSVNKEEFGNVIMYTTYLELLAEFTVQ
jgi:hypothetical protein